MRISSFTAAADTSSWWPLIWAAALFLTAIAVAFLIVTIVGLGDGHRGRHARSQQRQIVRLMLAVINRVGTEQADQSGASKGER
jgi:hypothetical protein